MIDDTLPNSTFPADANANTVSGIVKLYEKGPITNGIFHVCLNDKPSTQITCFVLERFQPLKGCVIAFDYEWLILEVVSKKVDAKITAAASFFILYLDDLSVLVR